MEALTIIFWGIFFCRLRSYLRAIRGLSRVICIGKAFFLALVDENDAVLDFSLVNPGYLCYQSIIKILGDFIQKGHHPLMLSHHDAQVMSGVKRQAGFVCRTVRSRT